MSRVFIGGSRKITRLNIDIRKRLDRIIERLLPVLIGDANGADKAVQRYFEERGYGLVEVFCSDRAPRNNVGSWPVRIVRPSHATRDFDYYATKDRVMAKEATVGFMIWDGQSRGTLLNVLRLVTQDKKALVYVTPKDSFTDVRTHQDFERLVASLDRGSAERLHEQALSEGLTDGGGHQPQLPL